MKYLVILMPIVLCIFGCNNTSNKINSRAIQVIDSVQFKSNTFIYWYRLDNGIYGYSDCKLAVSSELVKINEDENLFFISDYISEINYKAETNELIIHLHYNEYRLFSENLPRNIKLEIEMDGDIGRSYQYRLNKFSNQ